MKRIENKREIADLILRHEKAIKVLQAIFIFRKRKQNWNSLLNGIFGDFNPERYKRNIDICDRCIERLNERYRKLTQ